MEPTEMLYNCKQMRLFISLRKY